MTHKIVISATESIISPNCSHHFPLDQRITRQTIERYESGFEQVFAEQRKEAERHALIDGEYRKKIGDAQRANDDLRRKLEQGSQQLQGEVLELELELELKNTLAHGFVHDLTEEVKKGQRGADVVQTVRTPMGQVYGKIIWEAKHAEHRSDTEREAV